MTAISRKAASFTESVIREMTRLTTTSWCAWRGRRETS